MSSTHKPWIYAAALLSASALLSRVVGYARDVVLAAQLGAGPQTDAYFAAFLLPDVLYYLLSGGAFSLAFLPLFTRLQAQDERERAWRLFTWLAVGGTLVLGLTLTVAWHYVPHFVAIAYRGMDAETQALTVSLTRWVLPGPVFFFLGGLIAASQAAEKRFLASALPPLLYNVSILMCGLAWGSTAGAHAFAWGVLAGAILGSFFLALVIAWPHLRWQLRGAPRSAASDVRTYLVLALPLMIGVTLVTADEWFGRYFGAQVDAGALSTLQYARRLVVLPVALVGMAVGQASLPYLTELWARRDLSSFRRFLSNALTLASALGVLATTVLMLWSQELVGLLYERGAFGAAERERTAHALAILAPMVALWAAQTIAVRALYAREDTWRPMLLGTAVTALAFPVYAFGTQQFGLPGLAGASVVAFGLHLASTLLMVHRWHGDVLWGVLARALGRGALAGAAGAMAALLVAWSLPSTWMQGPLGQLLVLGVHGSVGAAILLVLLGDAGSPLRNRVAALLRRAKRGGAEAP